MTKPRNTDLSSRNVLRTKPFDKRTSQISGPISWLNPTVAHIHHEDGKLHAYGDKARYAFQWSSRNNRKGRHGLVLSPSLDASSTPTPAKSTSLRVIASGIIRMATVYPYWDVSWLVATIFTLGSVVWVLNAFFVFMPFIKPSETFSGESLYAGGITAFIGATIFEIGSVLLMIEAVNENRADCFGWAVGEALEHHDHEKGTEFQLKPSQCNHHHANRRNFVGGVSDETPRSSDSSDGTGASPAPKSKEAATRRVKQASWIWWPTWTELRLHYLREIGFIACSAQMFGATIFWISGFTALPGIINKMSPGLTDGIYWVPQIVGGCGFVVSGTLFMLETQKKWYIPALGTLGWHIGFWNWIGGIGFTLCPCLGLDTASWAQYQASCSTFWASWAFLIGSVIQWYESMDKHPVEVGEVDS